MRDFGSVAAAGAILGAIHASLECLFGSPLLMLLLPPDRYIPLGEAAKAASFAVFPVLWASVFLLVRLRRHRAPSMPAPSAAHALLWLGAIAFLIAGRWLTPGEAVVLGLLATVPPAAALVLAPAQLSRTAAGTFLLAFAADRWVARGESAPEHLLAFSYAGCLLAMAGWLVPRLEGAGSRLRRLPAIVVPGAAACLGLAVWIDSGVYIRLPDRPVLSGPATRPNVLLITMDTVRADHTSVYGYSQPTTPSLERLARQSTKYELAFSTADWTLPSHASIFTGLYPHEHGAGCPAAGARLVRSLDPEAETMAELLGRNGYRTAAIVANAGYLAPSMQLDQGFHSYRVRTAGALTEPRPGSAIGTLLRRVAGRLLSGLKDQRPSAMADRISAEAGLLLEIALRRGEPLFLFLNYMDAHTPYNPPPPFDEAFGDSRPPVPQEEFVAVRDRVNRLEREMGPDFRKRIVAKYDGGIAYADQQIGLLLERLRRLGAFDNTMVIVTSDHGEAFGGRDLVEHHVSAYQNQIGVPLLIKWPNQREPAVVDEPVSGVDLLPSVLDVAGVPLPANLADTSLARPLPPGRLIVGESVPCDFIYEDHPRFQRDQYAAIQGPWKLLASTSGERELYNLAADPGEREDQAGRQPGVAKTLDARLLSLLASTGPRNAQPAAVTPEHMERLKSLGYAQ